MLQVYTDVITNFESQKKKEERGSVSSEADFSDRRGKSPNSYTSSERYHHRRTDRPRE